MGPLIATYPPLGQVTKLGDSIAAFHAVLEVSVESATAQWQLSLWHSSDSGGNWVETELLPDELDAHRPALDAADRTNARLYFTASLTVQSLLSFTIKFREGPDHPWRWIRDEQGLGDGIVVIDQELTGKDDPDGLPDLIQHLNPDLKLKSHLSQSPGTRLWSIEAAVDGAKDDESAYAEVPIGIPWGRFLRWFALVRPWTPWLAPRHGKSSFELDKEALLCSFLSPHGKHLVFLGISGVDGVITLLRSGDSGRLMLHIRNDDAHDATGTVLVAVGDHFESAVAAVMYHARTLVMAANAREGGGSVDVKPEWYENWYDGLGYCTWNALGQQLTEEKVLKAVDTLAEKNINISSLIIDDNWQDIDYTGDGQWQHGWNDFEAEPKAFPRGLKALVSDIRSKHKNIQYIAVWHALLGYWAGLAPGGPLTKRYKTVEVIREDGERRHLPTGGKMTIVANDDTQRFYDDFYRFLTSCGIDGVKTDAQYMLDTWVSPQVRRELTNTYLDAWTLSSLRHFSGRVISCMSQAPQILFHSQLPHNRPPVVYRNSDDFFPLEPASHPWHVWANGHNALLTQHLNVLPDWDMFQTGAREYAGFHAAARCVSGGPIYITDVPGQHDVGLIKQMTGVTPRGRTVIFRPSVLGRTMDVYNAYEDPALLKIGAYHGRAESGASIVGVFNVSMSKALTELIPLARFPGVVSSARYVVRSHVSGKVTPPLAAGAPASLLTVSLPARGFDILCAFPLAAFTSRTRGEVLLASLGLVGKMTGCAAVLSTVFDLRENGRMLIDTNLKALGVLGIYVSSLPELSVEDDFMVTIQGQPIPPHTVSVNEGDRHLLNVDIETAWREMGLESGWANEVQVKVYFAMERK
ncbi:Raffinose synthase Sip1 [Madurella fahalii]|uniref:Raffinose synthase Sip1 n=1 Tax=Madurella fahalii TaxID=1157608 RepID=A0ABQ0FYI9_9PEZI